MSVREVAASDPAALKNYVRLERALVGSEPLFVSETDSDVKNYLSGRSAFCEGIEHTLFLASKGRDVARCAAFVNHRYQESHNDDPAGFIGYFAAAPHVSREVGEMLDRAEEWLATRGVGRVIAPFNISGLIGYGLRTTAFEEEPMLPFNWNPPHYADYLEEAGYRPSYPMYFYEIDFSSEEYRASSRRAIEEAHCRVRPLDKRRGDEEIETLLYLFNEGYGPEEWELQRFTSAEFREYWGQFKPVTDPRQFLFAEVGGEAVGNCLGVPDWNPLLRSFRGRMGPIQVVRFLLGYKRFRRAGLINIVVLPGHRGEHIGQTLAATLYRYYEELGLSSAFYYSVNETNTASRRFAESFGGRGRVLYHVYDKALS
jgi:GNAT superfamily N-acetyltransferase